MKIFKIGIMALFGLVVLLMAGFGQSKPKQKIYEAKSATLGEITVGVRPEKLGVGEAENIFGVKFDTHTVDLNLDFEKIISLVDNLGNNYQALRREGGRGGHHLEGKVIFPKLKTGAQMVTLKIFQVGGPERTFSWEL